ncbi:MAG: PLDc N-terminal domain-containing protein, partial [Clostridia bacterium]|nr:PLDc N-terminal domain-containing protein [Clostridia bacterium]
MKNKDNKIIVKTGGYLPLRYALAIFITIAEIVLIIALIAMLCAKYKWFYLVAVLIQFACVLKVISSDDNPDYKAPWLFIILILPIVGFTLYILLYSRKLGRLYRKRFNEISKRNYTFDDSSNFKNLKEENESAFVQAKMLCKIADTHLFANCKQEYFSSGESA